ncbi:MAG: IS30 family transposase, partial [Thioalkalivibrio sp.]
VYRDAARGGQLHRNLWQRRPRRRMRRDRLPAHSRIANRVDISERPQIVDQRARVGDWEGDMVVSCKKRGGLVTHLERVTRFLVAGRAKNKQAITFTAVTQRLFGWVPKSLCQTLTLDN